jgi:hypothetical protein
MDTRGRRDKKGLPFHCLARMNKTDNYQAFEIYRRNLGAYETEVVPYTDEFFGGGMG